MGEVIEQFDIKLTVEVEPEGEYFRARLVAQFPPCTREVERLTRDPERYPDNGQRTLMESVFYGQTPEEAASNLGLSFRERIRPVLQQGLDS